MNNVVHSANLNRGRLARLERWYSSNCNGDWEHTYGVALDTIDNPGWTISIDLVDTPLMDEPFSVYAERKSASDWIHCAVTDGIFNGSGSIGRLEEILETFLNWAEAREASVPGEYKLGGQQRMQREGDLRKY
jgi:hypothetical protein